MKAATVTLNPSIDVTLMLDGLDPDRANRVLSERHEAGGKGVNVNAVLRSLGVEAVAFGLAGGENYDRFMNLSGMPEGVFRFVRTGGAVRENLTLRAGDACVKVNRAGCAFDEYAFNRMCDGIISWLCKGDVCVISGSAPVGFDPKLMQYFCRKLRANGVLTVLDCEWINADLLRFITPHLIKPNLHEFVALTGVDAGDERSVCDGVERLCAIGAGNVIVSLGGDGMIAGVDGRLWRVKAPRIELRSTVGAGDSAVAGYVAALTRGLDAADRLALSAACGSGTASLEGSALCDEKLARKLLPEVEVREL